MPHAFGVVFDFDGTLADTERLHHQAFAEVLRPHGIPFTWEEYVARYIGFDDRGAFRTRFADAGVPLPAALERSLIREKSHRFDERAARGTPFLPGARALLESLASARVPMAICSGARRSDIDAVLNGSGLERIFATIVTADDVAAGKPDPEGYRLAAKTLRHQKPGLALVAAEDTLDGLRAARAAALATLAVATTLPVETLRKVSDLAVADLSYVGVEDLRHLALGRKPSAPPSS